MIKSIAILGCGESGQHWDGQSESIGVNDCWKFGHPTDYLMVIDPPGRFTPARRKIIQNSKPKHFITDSKAWLRHFYGEKAERIKSGTEKFIHCINGPQLMTYPFGIWKGKIVHGKVQHWYSSPFPAMSLAYLLGYKEIILWGVDFKTHKSWNPSKKAELAFQLQGYKEFVKALNEVGVKVYLGHHDSMLIEFLEVKKNQHQRDAEIVDSEMNLKFLKAIS
jgi:hypothetical protein